MNFSQESKSQLAKLLATENLTVEHRKMQTAMFDLKNRVLYCPIWTNMSGELYDLLLGHEVGHALETPAEGWHNALPDPKTKDKKNFKAFLNVVEDARIEKKMKRKFPGLRQSFVKAYGELIDRDFFGLKGRDINTMPFIDRLNLYTKGGVNLGIKFNDAEAKLLADVEACETWDDVVRVANVVYDHAKDELNNQESQSMPNEFGEFDPDGDYELSESDETESDDAPAPSDDGQESESENASGEKEGGEQDSGKAKASDDVEDSSDAEKEEGEQSVIERVKESKAVESDTRDLEPACETDDNFRANESLLLDKSAREYVYVSVPTPVMSEILTDYKRVHEQMEQCWNIKTDTNQYEKRERTYKSFKSKNDRYVSLLAKEFEMRKAASKFAKNKVSETGDIDVNRIYKYQIDDSIFKKIMRVPKGKSHGLVLLFDRSGSMMGNMQSTLEQIMVLAMFCRKVNIPFVVYGFGNETGGFRYDHGRTAMASFSRNEGELFLDNVFLREYLNSKMSVGEFNRCMKNLSALADVYSGKYTRKFVYPHSESLSNTPMIEAMVAMKTLTDEFRKVNNLDIVNMVLLHDGDADTVNGKVTGDHYQVISSSRQNIVVIDKKHKLQFNAQDQYVDSGMRHAIFEWYRQTTGAKIVGFYIVGSSGSARSGIMRRYVAGGKTIDEMFPGHSNHSYFDRKQYASGLAKKLNTDKFLESSNRGYNKFFIIPGDKDLAIENDSLHVDGQVTASKLKNAFIKMNMKRQVSRVLVNRFIGEIAV